MATNRIIVKFSAMALAAVLIAAAFTLAQDTAAVARNHVTVPGQVSVEECPDGYRLGIGILVEIGTGIFTECYGPDATWDAELAANFDFAERIRAAEAEAEAKSRAWAEAHIGEQNCFQWGPVVHSNGVSTASGGVCANAVPVPDPSASPTPSATLAPSPSPSATAITGEPLSAPAEVSAAYLGTTKQMPTLVANATTDKVESARLIMLFFNFGRVAKSAKVGAKVALPPLGRLFGSYRSLTPKVCSVVGATAKALTPGTCRMQLSARNSQGNRFTTATVVAIKRG